MVNPYHLSLTKEKSRVEMTARDDGASVEWIGSTCQKSKEVISYNITCELYQMGKFYLRIQQFLAQERQQLSQ